MGTKGLEDVKNVITAILSTFRLQKRDGVHVGVLTCAKRGKVILKFDDTYSMPDIMNVLKSIKLKGRKFLLEQCLKEANDNLFDIRSGVRNHVGKYLFIFGKTISPLSRLAAVHPLQNQGVKVIGMSLSNHPVHIKRMKSISSQPHSIWFKHIRRRELESTEYFARAISELICKGMTLSFIISNVTVLSQARGMLVSKG